MITENEVQEASAEELIAMGQELPTVEEEHEIDLFDDEETSIEKLPTLSDIADTLEDQMASAPVITDEVGLIERSSQVESLKKVGYYAVFAPMDHQSSEIGTAIKGVHIARFETKAHLRRVIMTLEEKGFKLIDILKGRPLHFAVVSKKVHEITIGD